jgi:hypothetical protein
MNLPALLSHRIAGRPPDLDELWGDEAVGIVGW